MGKVCGMCRICGEEKELTFEHIPPRSAFNTFALKLYDFLGFIKQGDQKYQLAPRGVGEYTLCSSCNNLTGKWYGAAYAEFAQQGVRYYKGGGQGDLAVPYTIYPLRVFKQIVSCFASVNGVEWRQKNPGIKDFLLNPEQRSFPKNIDIRMYMQCEGRTKINPIMGVVDTLTGGAFVGSEWGFLPFSYIFVADVAATTAPALNGLYSLLPFLQYDYDQRVTLYLKIPRRPCNPTPLDFREGVPDIATLIQTEKNKQR